MSKRNTRPLDKIADQIHKLQRKNIFDIGDLLLEAKAQCEYGEWGEWLEQFGWSWTTADRYAATAELASKFPNLRNLKLPVTIFYNLLEEEDHELPAIVDELSKHARKAHLTVRQAWRAISVGIGRHRYGEYPDATLARLVECGDAPWASSAIAALMERKPEDDEGANAIVEQVRQDFAEALRIELAEDEINSEIESILDGDPPSPPRPTPPRESERFGRGAPWPEATPFAEAVTALHELMTKPVARFVGAMQPEELRAVADFLVAIATSTKEEAA